VEGQEARSCPPERHRRFFAERARRALKRDDRHARGDWPEVCRRCTYYDSVWPAWLIGEKRPADPSGPVDPG